MSMTAQFLTLQLRANINIPSADAPRLFRGSRNYGRQPLISSAPWKAVKQAVLLVLPGERFSYLFEFLNFSPLFFFEVGNGSVWYGCCFILLAQRWSLWSFRQRQ
jgi:hypothetical protein